MDSAANVIIMICNCIEQWRISQRPPFLGSSDTPAVSLSLSVCLSVCTRMNSSGPPVFSASTSDLRPPPSWKIPQWCNSHSRFAIPRGAAPLKCQFLLPSRKDDLSRDANLSAGFATRSRPFPPLSTVSFSIVSVFDKPTRPVTTTPFRPFRLAHFRGVVGQFQNCPAAPLHSNSRVSPIPEGSSEKSSKDPSRPPERSSNGKRIK